MLCERYGAEIQRMKVGGVAQIAEMSTHESKSTSETGTGQIPQLDTSLSLKRQGD